MGKVNTKSVDDLLKQALALHQTGQHQEAELRYRRLLASAPNHPQTLHFLGVLLLQRGQVDEAITLIGKAVAVLPDYIDAVFNLGNAQKQAGLLAQAEQSFRKAVKARPQQPVFLCNLGNVLIGQGKFSEAVPLLQQAVQADPRQPLAYNSLGIALSRIGLEQQAESAYRSAIAAQPGYENAGENLASLLLKQSRWQEAEQGLRQLLARAPTNATALNRLGVSLLAQNRFAQALTTLQQAVAIDPRNPEIHIHLGQASDHLRLFDQAETHFQRALALEPHSPQAGLGLASVLESMGQCEEAIARLQAVLARHPEHVAAHNNLANTLRDVGRYAQAISHYERALNLDPAQVVPFNNLLNAMNFVPDHSAEDIFQRHCDFERIYASPLRAEIRPHHNQRDPQRRLRIGYVSAGFWNYPVGRFIEPVLAHADRDQFETYCYYTHVVNDATNAKLRSYGHHWRDCAQLSDAALAEQIRTDSIDILVDLIGHIEGSRLLVFARKPAPVQATWLAYMNTTGLATMDYRITDRFADPVGEADQLHSEKLHRLPASQWCYAPPASTPAPSRLPALSNGYLTFGSFNAFTKVNPAALQLWGRILTTLPDARLLIMGVAPGQTQAQLAAFFAALGIGPERVSTRPFTVLEDYFAAYNQVDIALDTFPYSGGTTTCDGFWMGVPVITMPGRTSASRSSTSLLANLGFSQFIARDAEHYAAIAAAAARDIAGLAVLRENLRQQMQNSPLMDGPRMAQDLQDGYRSMWRDYLEQS